MALSYDEGFYVPRGEIHYTEALEMLKNIELEKSKKVKDEELCKEKERQLKEQEQTNYELEKMERDKKQRERQKILNVREEAKQMSFASAMRDFIKSKVR